MRKYMLRRYHKRRQEAIDYLGSKCSICESVDNLEIDHIDSNKKEIALDKLWSIAKHRYWKELEKCQLLCNSCHITKTIKDKGNKPAKGKHGTVSSYKYCRCEECKTAKRECQRRWRAKKKQD